jgi:phosphoserine phosphatase RsbU/P
MKPVGDVKILLVEDDPFFVRILQKRISSEGYQVLVAADGREGMKAIVASEPDLVISDWMMPEVDGLELCQSVKTGLREAAPYFILLTAKGEISDKLLGLQTGADDYLVKPCDHGELLARIRAGLRIVSLTQELRRTVADLQVANAELESARAEVARLQGVLALCPECKRVRDASGAWQEIEGFLAGMRQSALPRDLCPECTSRSDAALQIEREP